MAPADWRKKKTNSIFTGTKLKSNDRNTNFRHVGRNHHLNYFFASGDQGLEVKISKRSFIGYVGIINDGCFIMAGLWPGYSGWCHHLYKQYGIDYDIDTALF